MFAGFILTILVAKFLQETAASATINCNYSDSAAR
jgi:hypothetical protein